MRLHNKLRHMNAFPAWYCSAAVWKQTCVGGCWTFLSRKDYRNGNQSSLVFLVNGVSPLQRPDLSGIPFQSRGSFPASLTKKTTNMMLPFFIAALHHGMAAVIVPSSHDSVDRLFWNTQRFIDYVAMPLFLITSFLLVAMPGAPSSVLAHLGTHD